MWEDLKFDLKLFNHIERLAIVGETKWEKGMSVFCRPFTTAKIKYFDKVDLEKARAWIEEERATNRMQLLTVEKLGMLLGLSFFLGLSFEGFYWNSAHSRPGGIRTFPLISLSGAGAVRARAPIRRRVLRWPAGARCLAVSLLPVRGLAARRRPGGCRRHHGSALQCRGLFAGTGPRSDRSRGSPSD